MGGEIMGTKKPFCIFVGLLVITIWILGFPAPGLSETVKCKSEMQMGQKIVEQVTAGYFIGVNTRDGSANCDNGETAHLQAFATWDVFYESFVPKEGIAQGYVIFTFKDNSKIITRFKYRQTSDPKGEAEWIWEAAPEIVKGTLRFEGIKGTLSLRAKQLPSDSKTVGEWIINYTLPPK